MTKAKAKAKPAKRVRVAKPKTPTKQPTRPAGGRPPYRRSEDQAKLVESMTGFGATSDDVAKLLKISAPTLRKYYREELDLGVIKANAQVAESLFKKALGNGPQSGACAIFWAKTRMGWKETQVIQPQNPDGSAIQPAIIEHTTVLAAYTDEELKTLEEIANRAAARAHKAGALTT